MSATRNGCALAQLRAGRLLFDRGRGFGAEGNPEKLIAGARMADAVDELAGLAAVFAATFDSIEANLFAGELPCHLARGLVMLLNALDEHELAAAWASAHRDAHVHDTCKGVE